MRNLLGFILLSTFAISGLYIWTGLELASGAPALKVLSWWWEHGEGQLPILLCMTGFLGFSLIFFLWFSNWIKICWGTAIDYVFLGSSLESDRNYYCACDDPTQQRHLLRLQAHNYNRSASTPVDLIFSVHKMLRLGSDPTLVELLRGFNFRSQLISIFLQYVTLFWGLAALAQIITQYLEQWGHPIEITLLPIVAAISLSPLLFIQVLGLLSGYAVFRKRYGACEPNDHKPHELDLKPGATVSVRLMENGRDGGKSQLTKRAYRVEWPTEDGLTVSAIIAFYVSRKIKCEIEELDRLTKRQEHVECRVSEDYMLHPIIFANPKAVDWY